MFTVEYEEVELDICGACQGIWLDANELDLLLGDHAMTEGFLSSGDPNLARGEKERPCPLCDSPMRKLVAGGTKPIVHDCCPKGHGARFDGGELALIIEQGSEADQDLAVVRWLRGLFPNA